MRALRIGTVWCCLAGAPGAALAQAAPGGPPCARAVADGARVRVRLAIDGTRHAGTALGWATPAPRVVTGARDTLAVGRHDRREVSGGRTGHHAWAGLTLGLIAGNLSNLHCFGERTCGEQNPLPFVGMITGVLIGRRIRRERWVPVSDDGTCVQR